MLRVYRRNLLDEIERYLCYVFYAPAPRVGALSDDARLTFDVCLSIAYIGPKSRTERLRQTKIGTEVASPRHT